MQLLADESFLYGFNLKGLNSIKDGHASIKSFRLTDRRPAWYLCQWNSKYNLVSGAFTVEKDRYDIRDESKSLTVIDGKKLIFALDATKEYSAPRAQNEPWPHLLIEQEIVENNAVRDLCEIVCHARFRLLEFVNFMQGAERDYHTAQFVWVVTLKDANPASASYNSFIWVVLCPFDSRYEFSPLFTQQDMALPDGEFIYSFAGSDFMNQTLWNGEEVEINFDLYPYLDKILSCAKSRGFMRGSRKEDLVISSTNMGFEITGTFRCKISAEDVKITIEKK